MTTVPSESAATLTQMARLLGDGFLRYVLNVDDEQPLEQAQFSAAQQEVRSILAHHFSALGADDSTPVDTYMRTSSLAQPVPNSETSLVNVLREMAGGTVETAPNTGDAVADAAIKLARDIWPFYLIRPRTDGPRTFWMSTPAAAFAHGSFERLVDAALADSRLMKLFPFPPTPQERSPADGWAKAIGYMSLVLTSNGRGGSLQLVTLLSDLISNSVFRCLIAGERLSLATLSLHIVAATEDLRRLAENQIVDVPCLVGLAGVTLPRGSVVDLPDGSLRPACVDDQELFMSGSPLLATVFETTYPMRIFAVEEHDLTERGAPFKNYDKFRDRISESGRSFNHKFDLVRMGLFLASSPDKPWLAREVSRYVVDPLSHGGSSSWDPGISAVPAFELDADHFDAVRSWHRIVTSKHHPSLDIGMRRLLSASTTRTDPIDAFVDAVICWENMFGVRTETNFRVTASIAKLLVPTDSAARETAHKELKSLYAKRSALVHGGSEPKPDELAHFETARR